MNTDYVAVDSDGNTYELVAWLTDPASAVNTGQYGALILDELDRPVDSREWERDSGKRLRFLREDLVAAKAQLRRNREAMTR
jgi:hypothetical protein